MENDNPKNISEVERIKWLISRIDLYHKNILENIDNSQQIFQNAGEKASNRVRSWRRGIFSLLGAIISVVFGLNTLEPFESWLIYLILALVSTAGFLNYLILNWVQSFANTGFDLISFITGESHNRISESQTFVTAQFADLGFLDLKVIKNYGAFALLLNIAIQVYMMNELKKQKSYKTKWLVNVLKGEFKTILWSTEQVPKIYASWDSTQLFPKNCFDLVEKTLKKYAKKKEKEPKSV